MSVGGLSQALAELTETLVAEATEAGIEDLPVVVGAESEQNKVGAPPSIVLEPVSESLASAGPQRISPNGPRVLRMRRVTVRTHIHAADLDQAEALISAVVNAVQRFASASYQLGEATWFMGEITDHGVAYSIPLTLDVPLYRRERTTTISGIGAINAELDTSTP